jgi:hypothetical protein
MDYAAPLFAGGGAAPAGFVNACVSVFSAVGDSAAALASALVAEVGSSAFDEDAFSDGVLRGSRPTATLFILLFV